MTFAANTTIPTVRFAHYGPKVVGDGITLHDLMAIQARDGLLIARAEDSGSEGTYCEVCIWNALTSRFERYAFKKFLGGEFDINGDTDDVMLAEHCAKLINNASYAVNGRRPPLIHHMPTYTAPDSDELKKFNTEKAGTELLAACELLLGRLDEDEDRNAKWIGDTARAAIAKAGGNA